MQGMPVGGIEARESLVSLRDPLVDVTMQGFIVCWSVLTYQLEFLVDPLFRLESSLLVKSSLT
jgi:hypothetical protein